MGANIPSIIEKPKHGSSQLAPPASGVLPLCLLSSARSNSNIEVVIKTITNMAIAILFAEVGLRI